MNAWVLIKLRTGRRVLLASLVVLFSLALATAALAATVTGGADVKVTNDNNNVDGGTPNPGFDAQNRQSNETTVAINPVNPDIVAAGANDYRMVTVTGDVWFGLYVSADGGATWFNTLVPGFPSDTSPAGLASPLLGLDGSGDPVVRFDSEATCTLPGLPSTATSTSPTGRWITWSMWPITTTRLAPPEGRAHPIRLPIHPTSPTPARPWWTGVQSALPYLA